MSAGRRIARRASRRREQAMGKGTSEPARHRPVNIRRIRADEGARLKAIRVAALTDSPEAFGQTLQEALDTPDRDYADRARSGELGQDHLILVAESEDLEWMGIARGWVDGEAAWLY